MRLLDACLAMYSIPVPGPPLDTASWRAGLLLEVPSTGEEVTRGRPTSYSQEAAGSHESPDTVWCGDGRGARGGSRMRVDIRVPVGWPVPQVADFIRRCEDAGFHGVGVHDHPHSGRDVYVTLALAAERTSRLVLYPATSNPVTRHPLVLASLAHSLDEIAPGRVRLSVAPGFLAVRSIGRHRARIETIREAVVVIRRLLAGETVPFGSTQTRLRNTSRPAVPVYLLAAGPHMVELAGEVADGALLMVGLHPRSVTAARQRLQEGARRTGRDLRDFPTVFIAPFALDPESHLWPKRYFAPGHPWVTYPSRSNLFWLREAGLDIPEDLNAITDTLSREICDAFGLFGPPEACAERMLRARDEAGVEHVFLFPAHTHDTAYDMPAREVEAFRTVIAPRIGT